MNGKDFAELAVEVVTHYHNEHLKEGGKSITEDNVYIVWICKTLQNNKALLSTTVPDGMYYEFTWNGDRGEGYLDAYKKQENVVVKPEIEGM